MRRSAFLLLCILSFIAIFWRSQYAFSEAIIVKGENIPVMKGATFLSKSGDSNKGSKDYVIEADFDSIVSYYNNYFLTAGWQIMGEPVGKVTYSAILYKDGKGLAFEVKPYGEERGRHLLRFQW